MVTKICSRQTDIHCIFHSFSFGDIVLMFDLSRSLWTTSKIAISWWSAKLPACIATVATHGVFSHGSYALETNPDNKDM